MNSRRFMPALLAALAISIVCTLLVGRKITAHEGARPANRRYVAAANSIAPGEILKADEVNYVDWPAGEPLEGAFTKVDDVIGRPVLYPLEKGQLILSHLLAVPGAGFGLTTKIPAGMRAIALKSDEVVGVAGFLFPGSRVDVLVTYHAQNQEAITATVLQDAQVVAVGHQIQPDPNGKPASVDVITILAKPEDAEKVVLASTQGTIHFVLRNATDRAVAGDPAVNLSQFASDAPTRPATARRELAAAEKPKPYVVETILGDKETSTSFWPAETGRNRLQ